VLFAGLNPMNQEERLRVFQAQTANVRELNSAWVHLKRSIHPQLLSGNEKGVEVHTRLLALTYCAWTEALFSKLIHTPYGFDLDEIDQIKTEARTNGVTAGWRRCLTLAIRHVEGERAGHLANVTQSVNRLIDRYIESPSLVRNKIAHGQVVIALNRDNTDVNYDLTSEIEQLNIVALDRHKYACQGMADIVEAIIESPQKGAMRDYWTLTQQVTDHLTETEGHSIETKIALLREKAAHSKRFKATGPASPDAAATPAV
jgi:hypothetical protein